MRGLDPMKDMGRALADKVFGPYKGGGGGGSMMSLPTIGIDDCWCGRGKNHDWPDKEDGAPHPRWSEV